MYHRVCEDPGRVRGVLCDWDLAYDPENPYPHQPAILEATTASDDLPKEIVIEEHDEEHVGPCYRTGTGPFMALDLLAAGKSPFHLYRHDLESFFFVLVWFCAVFNPETNTLRHLKNWESPDLVYIGKNKRAFISESPTQEQVFDKFHDEYKPLVSLWIENLIDLFEVVNVKLWRKVLKLEVRKRRAEENGKIRQTRLLSDELRTVQQKRNEAIDYRKFMRCLGVNVDADTDR